MFDPDRIMSNPSDYRAKITLLEMTLNYLMDHADDLHIGARYDDDTEDLLYGLLDKIGHLKTGDGETEDGWPCIHCGTNTVETLNDAVVCAHCRRLGHVELAAQSAMGTLLPMDTENRKRMLRGLHDTNLPVYTRVLEKLEDLHAAATDILPTEERPDGAKP